MKFSTKVPTAAALAFFLAAGLPATFAQKVVRNWSNDPAVVQIDTTADIFAIGDVHADLDRLVTLLSAARIVERVPGVANGVRWSAGKAVVVFTGDLIDKGPNAIGVLNLLRVLRDQAAQAGGRVVITMGNHEADFLRKPDSNKAKEFASQLRAAGLDPKEIAACGGDLGAFLCSMPFAARVNDWFFSHAGNTGGRTLRQLISDLQSGVDRDGFATPQLADENSLIQARLGGQGSGGKSWFEQGEANQSADTVLAANAAALGVAHLVQGHQHANVRFPDGKRRKIGAMYQWHGKLFLIDTGMSRDINDGPGAALHIPAGAIREAITICPDGRQTKLWDDKEKPNSAKGVRCGP